jgi:ABC-type uncharacterized transport system involved in gliding motility auxiliary subunit
LCRTIGGWEKNGSISLKWLFAGGAIARSNDLNRTTDEAKTVFTTLFQEVCQKFNISVPILGSDDGSVNGTLSPPPGNTTANASSPAVPSPFVGSANAPFGPSQPACTALAALVVLVMLGVLL